MTFKTFPSGAHALAIGAEYTKVYVAGWLQQGDKKVGVRLHYQTAQAGTGTLPERGHTYEMSLKGEHTLDVSCPRHPSSTSSWPTTRRSSNSRGPATASRCA